MSTEPAVLTSVDDGVLTIIINRPERRNAVNREVRGLVRAAVDQLEGDQQLRAGIITGAGTVAFSAGIDLVETNEGITNRIGDGGFAGIARLQRSKPLIAAVNGAALGGGFELVLACDLVVVTPNSWFSLPEPLRGIIPGGGGAVRLPELLPKAIANGLLLTGAKLSAEDAVRWGLANVLVEPQELLTTAAGMAKAISAAAPLAVTATLAIAGVARRASESAAWETNDAHVRLIRTTDDAKEGVAAFSEKRSPKWAGR